MHSRKKRLGELLIEAGVIDEHQLRSALGHQKQWGVKIGQALVDLKIATELQIVDALSKKLGIETMRLDLLEPSPAFEAALKLVPRELARAQNLLPVSTDVSSVTIAMSDPTNVAIVDEIAFRTGKKVRIVLAGDREIARNIRKYYFPEELVRPAAIEVPAGGEPLETTTDWFASLPPGMREDYLGQQQAAPPPAPAATPAPVTPIASVAPPAPTMTPVPVAPAPAMTPLPTMTPPPVPARGPSTVSGVGTYRTVSIPPAAPGNGYGPSGANEAALANAIERMLKGEKAPGGLEPGRLAAAAVTVLLRRGLVTEAELLAELMRR